MTDNSENHIFEVLDEIKDMKSEIVTLRDDMEKFLLQIPRTSTYELEKLVERLNKLIYIVFSQQIVEQIVNPTSLDKVKALVQDKIDEISHVYQDNKELRLTAE